MNEEIIRLCAEAKQRRDKALAASGQARHQGFYIGEILAEHIRDSQPWVILKLLAQVVREYKAVPETMAEIADGLET